MKAYRKVHALIRRSQSETTNSEVNFRLHRELEHLRREEWIITDTRKYLQITSTSMQSSQKTSFQRKLDEVGRKLSTVGESRKQRSKTKKCQNGVDTKDRNAAKN